MISKTTCPKCGDEFESIEQTAVIAGRSFSLAQSICDTCISSHNERFSQNEPTTRTGWAQICPPLYAQFDASKLPSAGSQIMSRVLTWQMGTKGIGLKGDSFAGKSMLIHELARIQYEAGRDIHVTSSIEFANVVGSGNQDKRLREIERCSSAEILLIDDIGKEKMTDRVETDLYGVLEMRRRYLRPLITSMNSTGGQLAQEMSGDRGVPIINRVRDICEVLSIPKQTK